MARQILQSGPSERSLRQRAFQEGISQAVSGASGAFESAQRSQNREEDIARRQTERQQAFDLSLAQQGITPEVQQVEQSQDFVGPAPQTARSSALGQVAQQVREQRSATQGLREREFGLKERGLDIRSRELGAKRQEKKDLRARELETQFGQARTKTDAKDIKKGAETKEQFDRKLQELIKLRGDFGGEVLNREAVNRGKQLSKQLLLSLKDMAKLGVLSQSDEKILNQIIPDDPLQFRSPLEAASGQDSILSGLQKLQSDTQSDFESKLTQRLGDPEAGIRTARGGDQPAAIQDQAPGLAQKDPAKASRLIELRKKQQASSIGQR